MGMPEKLNGYSIFLLLGKRIFFIFGKFCFSFLSRENIYLKTIWANDMYFGPDVRPVF